MAMDRPRQMLLPLFTEPCYVCGYVFSEGLKGRWALPILNLKGDRLCVSHRARLQEGACLFCGRRLAWLHMAADPELAVCRPCFVDRRGEEVAQAVEAMQDGDALALMN